MRTGGLINKRFQLYGGSYSREEKEIRVMKVSEEYVRYLGNNITANVKWYYKKI